MPLYRSRLYESSPGDSPTPPYRARGWTADLRPLEVVADHVGTAPAEANKRGHMRNIIHSETLDDGRLRTVYAPEIVITAQNRLTAQRAVNLITAAKVLMYGDFTSGDPTVATPDDPEELEDLSMYEYQLGSSVCAPGYATATRIAAKATQKRKWAHALIKHWLSLRTCSTPTIEQHPHYGERFTVEQDPFNHAVMSQAIIAAFSAIEELGLEVRAGPDRPSKINGRWNPPVLDDLERRQVKAKVNPEGLVPWLVRSPPTRIERRYSLPHGQPASWARYSVRDRMVRIPDAIHRAGLLRSRVSSHRMHSLTRSLTIYDVVNVQGLARHLLTDIFEWP